MRKHCKRKHWNTAPGFNPVAHAIAGACITSDAALSELLTRELSAIESMTHGRGGMQEWHDLYAAIQLCETAAHMGIGQEALPSCKAALAALVDAARRHESTGQMGLSGAGITALRDVIEYHDLQRRSIPRSRYEEVIRKTAIRIKSKTDADFAVN